MRVKNSATVSNQPTWEKASRFVASLIEDIITLVNGKLTFSDNFLAQQLPVTFIAAATDTGVVHTLGFVPNGYIVVSKSGDFNIYDGATANTSSVLYLRASGAVSASIIVF